MIPRLLAVSTLLAGTVALGALELPALFSDDLVLQRDRPVAVWGTAAPGSGITVLFSGQHQSAIADGRGAWRVTLDPLPASAEPRDLVVRSGSEERRLARVLVGEVWLCSGQSNMEKPLGPRAGQRPTDDHEAAIADADVPLLRLFQVPHHGRPKRGVDGLRWLPCTPETVVATEFSAAAYWFGRRLTEELGVPVGLIHASFGGTMIEAWMPAAAFASDPALRDLPGRRYFAWGEGVQATELWRSMIEPLVPYTLRGFLWYQGEANVMDGDGAIYAAKLRALIRAWRAAWGDPHAPFYFALLAPFNYSARDTFPQRQTPEALPVFWEAQAAALDLPATGLIVTTDLAGDARDIHPTNKRDVGLRFAGLALAGSHGRGDPARPAHSPAIIAAIPRGTGIELRFSGAGAGLRSRDGEPLRDFSVAGADRVFHPAEARITGPDTVLVSSPAVTEPVAVRFGWHETANPNLINAAGLPAVPGRTDTWPITIVRAP